MRRIVLLFSMCLRSPAPHGARPGRSIAVDADVRRPAVHHSEPPGWTARRRRIHLHQLVDGNGEPNGRQGTADADRHAEPRSGDGDRPRLPRDLSSPARSTKDEPIVDRQHPHDLVMQAACQLARADRLPDRVHDRRRSDRRAGARTDGVHAPAIRRRQSRGAARPSHARLDPHRDGRCLRRARPRAVHDRSVALQRAGARRQPLGRDGSGRARLVVRARVVRAVTQPGSSRFRTGF